MKKIGVSDAGSFIGYHSVREVKSTVDYNYSHLTAMSNKEVDDFTEEYGNV